MEPRAEGKEAVIILGSGPNRIGQGIEFDYSCVHASMALSEAGYETIMVNCNPETVSTDYDTSDRLYFEPLTLEDVLEIVHAEQQAGPIAGVICQLGGQTPLGLAQGLADAGREDRRHPARGDRPRRGARRLRPRARRAGLPAPKHGMATSYAEAKRITDSIGYPVLVRPSYVLGGRGMEIVYDDDRLRSYIESATEIGPDRPVLVDRFIDDAVEIDVDAHLRRRGALPRRRDGAHRGGRHPLRRLVVRAAADHPRCLRDHAHPHGHRGDRPRRGGQGPAQHPVRPGLRRALRPRGQPARVPHGPVRLQGDRRPRWPRRPRA